MMRLEYSIRMMICTIELKAVANMFHVELKKILSVIIFGILFQILSLYGMCFLFLESILELNPRLGVKVTLSSLVKKM